MLDVDKFIALVEEEGALWDVGSAAYDAPRILF